MLQLYSQILDRVMAAPVIREHRLRGLDQVRTHIVDGGWKTKRLERADQDVLGKVFRIRGVSDSAENQLVDAHDIVLIDRLPIRVDRGFV